MNSSGECLSLSESGLKGF